MASKRERDDYQPHETRRHTATTRPINMARPRIPAVHSPDTSNLTLPEHIRKVVELGPAVDAIETAPLPHKPTELELDNLKKCWLAMPTWDIEYSVGFESAQDELAEWHDEQITQRARALGCSRLMSATLQELVRCWIYAVPPRSDLAARILASFR